MEAVEEEVVLVREAGPGLEGVDEGAGHDRPAVQHRVVRLVWGGHRHCHTFNNQFRYQTSLPYFGVKLSCVCLMLAYRKNSLKLPIGDL